MGHPDLALADHGKLVTMGSPLADELDYVIKKGEKKTPERFFGVSGKI